MTGGENARFTASWHALTKLTIASYTERTAVTWHPVPWRPVTVGGVGTWRCVWWWSSDIHCPGGDSLAPHTMPGVDNTDKRPKRAARESWQVECEEYRVEHALVCAGGALTVPVDVTSVLYVLGVVLTGGRPHHFQLLHKSQQKIG
ncbi:hypothetical protein BaRGS_00014865 [Batillaria attramentaria]|uniref:Uncharacterized protein n=1 Tax=Batillaria attramentaria TaxID=370345 RepID=A0ABD0L426_9CAEN